MRKDQMYPLGEVSSGGQTYRAYQMPFQNLYETLEATALRFPDKVGLIDPARQITYRDLRREVELFAAYLAGACGIGRGDRVAICMVNRIDFAVAFYGALKLGAAAVSLNSKLSGDEMAFILRDSEARCLVVDTRWYPKVEPKLPETDVRHTLFCQVLPAGSGFGTYLSQAADWPVPETVRDDSLPGNIMYTSGTTGKPKGAVMTHFNLMQGMYAYVVEGDLDDAERTVISVPVFHITGLNCLLTVFLFLGALAVLVPYFHAEDVLDQMVRYRATHIHAVATVFILLEAAMQNRGDLTDLRAALCGGGFISRETIARFCRKAPNCKFHPVYGMTETAGAGTFFPGHCLDSEIVDSCGKVNANCEIRILDDNDQPVPTGTSGEICFRGAFVIARYLRPEGNAAIRDGWLHSGDIGCFDEHGYLYIKDRKKDMINRGGEKVFSLAVENVIMEYGGIKQAVVFAVDDSLYGEVPAAVVIPEAGVEVDPEALRNYLREHLAHYKVPVYLEVRTGVPVTASGKVPKFLLRQEFNEKYAK